MTTPTPEKQKGFEQQIAAELQAMDLSADVLETQNLEVGRVSEIVRENASEDVKGTKKAQKTGFQVISAQVAGLLSGGNNLPHPTILPTPVVQKSKVRKALEKRTKKLVAEATKIQKSKNFSADKLEEILLEIRHLREILTELLQVTVERVEELYRRYVLGK